MQNMFPFALLAFCFSISMLYSYSCSFFLNALCAAVKFGLGD